VIGTLWSTGLALIASSAAVFAHGWTTRWGRRGRWALVVVATLSAALGAYTLPELLRDGFLFAPRSAQAAFALSAGLIVALGALSFTAKGRRAVPWLAFAAGTFAASGLTIMAVLADEAVWTLIHPPPPSPDPS
jgi:hypothetical protein